MYLGARDPGRGHTAVEQLAAQRGGGLDIRFVRIDVADLGSVEAAVKTIETQAGRLDVLVNNAGVMVEWGVQATDITAARLRDGYEVNAASPGLVPTDQNAAAPFPRGDRTTADGARVPVLLATLPADGPTGVFRGPDSLDEIIPW